jgi:hypothetical protein
LQVVSVAPIPGVRKSLVATATNLRLTLYDYELNEMVRLPIQGFTIPELVFITVKPAAGKVAF